MSAKKESAVKKAATELDLELIKNLSTELKTTLNCIDEINFSISDANFEIALLLKTAWERFVCLKEALNGTKVCKDCLENKLQDLNLNDSSLESSTTAFLAKLTNYTNNIFSNDKIELTELSENIFTLEKESDVLQKKVSHLLGIEFWTKRNKNIALGCVIAFVVVVLSCIIYKVNQPDLWNVTYFSNPNLAGRPGFINQEGGVTLNSRAQLTKMTGNSGPFSVRYETCLKVTQPKEISFELGSDDGSRLFVDNESLIQNWGPHAYKVITGKRYFSVGTHKITVEYNDFGGGARIMFKPDNISEFNEHLSLPTQDGRCL